MRRLPATAFFLAGALLAGPVASAAQAPDPVTVRTAGGVTVVADRIEEGAPDNLVVATGNVELTRGTGRLFADRGELNRATGAAVGQGGGIFYGGDDPWTGGRGEYNATTGTAVVYP